MEAGVRSQIDRAPTRIINFSSEWQVPQDCCAHSHRGLGIPCYQGVPLIYEKQGSVNLHKFIDRKTSNSFMESAVGEFISRPSRQSHVDEVLSAAKRVIMSGNNQQVPNTILPPRRRPLNNEGKC